MKPFFFAWKKTNSETLKMLGTMLLTVVFNDDNEDDKCDFKGFRDSKKEAIFSELLEYAKTRNVSLDKRDLKRNCQYQ